MIRLCNNLLLEIRQCNSFSLLIITYLNMCDFNQGHTSTNAVSDLIIPQYTPHIHEVI